jgi:hypothetical protein
MDENARIIDNSVPTSNQDGGGVNVSSGATFTMNNGTISGNTTGNTGGGIWLGNTATFTKSNGTITGSPTGIGGLTANAAQTSAAHKGHAVYWGKSGDNKKADGDVTGGLSTTDTTTGWTAATP